MALPTLSVILPNFNHGAYLPQAITAMVEQSAPPMEIIVVDDASTDDSVQVIQAWCRKHPTLKLVCNTKNTGVCRAFNKGLALARGDYVYIAAADDRVAPGFFEHATKLASLHPKVGIIFGDVIEVDDEGQTLSYLNLPGRKEMVHFTPESFLHEYVATEGMTHALCGATIYRRDCLVEMGGYREEVGHCSDALASKAVGLKYGACYVPLPFMYWRYSPHSLANSINPRKVVKLTAEVLHLLRSPPFDSLFPKELLSDWEVSYLHRQLINLARKLPQYHESLRMSESERLIQIEESFARFRNHPLMRFPMAPLSGIAKACKRFKESFIRYRSRRAMRLAETQVYKYLDPTLRRWGILARVCDSIPIPFGRKLRLPATAIHSRGRNAYSVSLPKADLCVPSDSDSVSFVRIHENGLPLNKPHCLPEMIEEQGEGRFGHWEGELYFSASDNSDPRSNGKQYTVVLPRSLLNYLKGMKQERRYRQAS